MAATTTTTTTMATKEDDDDIYAFISEQRRELLAAESLDSDLDYAFRLQLQEALNASLTNVASSSTAQSPQQQPPQQQLLVSGNDTVFSLHSLQSQEITKLEQEFNDRKQSELETLKLKEDLNRWIHDQKLAREILRIPEHEWRAWGNNFEKPFHNTGSSSSGSGSIENSDNECLFRMYFKGLTSEEIVRDKMVVLGGIGVAICDPDDNLVFEISKPLIGNGMSRQTAEIKALIEGLNAALALELNRILIFCDYHPLHQYIIGRWSAKQNKVAMLMNQLSSLQKKFAYCRSALVPRNSIKYAFKLAKDAIVSQVTRPAESGHSKIVMESCVICLEDTEAERVFSVDVCQHCYCFSCMKQHVEVKLLHGMVPKCPHEGCKSELTVDSCRKFLTSKLIETMSQRIKEASIPVSERIYCPYPECSALMSRNEVSDGSERYSAQKCLKCHRLFCINCKVPWHTNKTCRLYQASSPKLAEDVKLKSLATRNLWRQCVKCNHMIELAEGCYHMTCRCGCEFCYNCGAEWKDKKATCSCPSWDEDYILYDGNRLESDVDEDLSDYDSESDYFF